MSSRRGSWRVQVGGIALCCLCCGAGAAESAKTLGDVRVFAVYEPVLSQQDVDLLTRVHPDFICRGWFKWHHTPDWSRYASLAEACAEKGILLQGGITLSAVYPDENKMDAATFRNFAAHGTDGEPYHCRMADNGGWYQLSLYNPKVIDYLKQQVRLQIDAGAVGIWYDEVEGIYDWNPTNGYEAYACAAFRAWLMRKYCVGQGWREDDARWQTHFGIDLAKHGGSIRTFDYLRHLQTTLGKTGKPLAENPAQGFPRNWATSANPLYREWGFAWDRKAAGTFRFDTVAAIFADILADADRYARERYGRTLINTYNHNGTARPGVAFLQPHNGAQPPLRQGRLDGRASYLNYYEALIADAAEVCPRQPVVFFVDWPGEADRLTALPRTDQLNFFSIYIPEAYAAGGEFALPLRGYSYVSRDQGTLAALTRFADFYRDYAPFFRGSQALPDQPQGIDRLTLRLRTSSAGTTLHIVNHAFSTRAVNPLARTNLCVQIPWTAPLPQSVFAVSPDFPEQRPVACALTNTTLTLQLGTVVCSAVVVFPHAQALRLISGTAPEGSHITAAPSRAQAITAHGRFTLWLPQTCTTLTCLETGEQRAVQPDVAFKMPLAGAYFSGMLLDVFGIPMRHTELIGNGVRSHTDAWGRFRIARAGQAVEPVSIAGAAQISITPDPGDAFTAYRIAPARRTLGTFEHSTEGYWANWPDKIHVQDVITLTNCVYRDQPALQCTFAATPRVPWSNINSPSFTLAGADAVELTFAGDGTPRTIYAVLHAYPHFYRTTLALSNTAWTTQRIPLSNFRDEKGQAFHTEGRMQNVTFQLAPATTYITPAVFWIQRVESVTAHPVQRLWTSTEPFDRIDVEHRAAEHQPQRPPPVVAQRAPLIRFTDPAAHYLANWADKESAAEHPMVIVERVATSNASPRLRVTLPAGSCAWGNANIPLPREALKEKDGLVLRMRSAVANEDVTLALHTLNNAATTFYQTEVEISATLSDVVVPWAAFRSDKGVPFSPQTTSFVNLQICRPVQPLTRDCMIEMEYIDTITVRR